MQTNQQTIGARMRSALPYVTKGGRVVDVGTDHAYLPIYLVEQGLVREALAADVNEGPINSARANVAAHGLEDRISTLLTDGLHGVEDFCPDDVIVFGMGGELIVRILSEAPWIKDERIGLILQPMSRAAVLREWLLANGFAIVGEMISFEDKYYQTIAARYCGRADTYREEELMVGRWNIEHRPLLFEGFVRHEIAVLERIIEGKSRSEAADANEDAARKRKLEALL